MMVGGNGASWGGCTVIPSNISQIGKIIHQQGSQESFNKIDEVAHLAADPPQAESTPLPNPTLHGNL